MFLWRKDGHFLAKARRRARSERAAVFSEFAFIAPLLVLIVSAMIEFAMFWDARIMANHTAWTVGRQAAVYGDDLTFGSAPGKIGEWLRPIGAKLPALEKLTRDRGLTTTAFLMSTSGMGYFGGSPGQTAVDILMPFVGMLKGALEGIVKSVDELAKKIAEFKPFGDDGLFGLGGTLNDALGSVLKKIGDDLLGGLVSKVLTPLAEKVTGTLTDLIENKVRSWLDSYGSTQSDALHRFRQFFGACRRIDRFDDIVTITTYGNSTTYGGGSYRCFSKYQPLDFPQTFAAGDVVESAVAKAGGWPPNNLTHGMMKVTVAWPYSAGWLFPVVSGLRSDSSAARSGTVRAVGHSFAFRQPEIENEHLKSTGAVAFRMGTTNEVQEALKDLKDELQTYLDMCAFGMQYRITEEFVFVYDPRMTSIDKSRKYLKPLCDWYGFRKADGTYDRKKAQNTPDYDNSWHAITGDVKYHITMPTALKRVNGDKEGKGSAYLDKNWLYLFDGRKFEDTKPRNRYEGLKGRSPFFVHSQEAPERGDLSEKALEKARATDSHRAYEDRPLYVDSGGQAYRSSADVRTGGKAEYGISKMLTGDVSRETNACVLAFGGVNMQKWLTVYRTNEEQAVRTKEASVLAASRRANEMMTALEDSVRAYADEIGAVGVPTASGVGGMLPNLGENVDPTDPKALKAWFEKKVKDLKAESLKLYDPLDRAVGEVKDVLKPHQEVSEAILNRRRQLLADMAEAIESFGLVASPRSNETAYVELVTAALRESPAAPGYDLINDSETGLKRLEETIGPLTNKLEEVFAKETAYAKALGSGLAAEQTGRPLSSSDFMRGTLKLDKNHYGRADFTRGSDDDQVGDKWKLGAGGWRERK